MLLNQKSKKSVFVYGMLIPALILELFIHITPLILGFVVSVKEVNPRTMADWLHAPFAGIQNYKEFLSPGTAMNDIFWSSAWVTLKYGLLAKFFHFLFGFWGALLLNRDFKGRGFFRVIFMLPYAVPSFISAIAWKFMFQKEWGLVNFLLVDKLHLFAENPFWLVGDNAIFAIVAAQVWRGWSFHFIMILAGLQTIPTHLYEAATIDGAGPLTKFRVITLPELKPILTTLIVVNGMKIFNEFETTFVMLSENPPASANVMSVNIYKQAFGNFNFGVASANAVTWVLVIFAISLCLNKLLRLKED